MNEQLFDKNKTNIVKGAAVLLLLFHHFFLVKERLDVNGVVIADNVYSLLYPFIVQARICVWIFAFLSAYGLAKKWELSDKRTTKFIVHCWLNLMKQWWIVMFGMAILYQVFVGNIWDYYQNSWKLLILDIIEWNDFFGYPRILGNWYLCFAQLIIILFPFLYNFCKKYGIVSVFIIYVLMQFLGDGIVSAGGGHIFNMCRLS